MKKILILFLLFPSIVYSSNGMGVIICDYKEKARHNLLASNITFSVDYVEKSNSVEFFITITNLHPEIKIEDVTNEKVYQYTSSNVPKEIKIGGFKDGISARFNLYSKVPVCQTDLLFSKHVGTLPYNRFYKEPVCIDIPGFVLCKKWVKHNLSYDQFLIEVDKYKSRLVADEKPKQEENIIVNKIIKFFIDNYIYIGLGIIGLSSVSILIIKERKKNFRF